MKKFVFMSLLTAVMMVTTQQSSAKAFNVPLQLDYGLIKKAMITQLYTGQNHTAELWHDKQKCSYLTLSDLKINGEQGNIRLLNNVNAKFGTAFAGQCVTVLQWRGVLETVQQPTLSADRRTLSLPVIKATAYDQNNRQLTIDKLQDLIKRVAEPQLASIKLDLNASQDDIEHTVAPYLPTENVDDVKALLKTLIFTRADVNADGVAVELSFDAPTVSAEQSSAAPLTASEQQHWQAAWQDWDKFLTHAIEQAGRDSASPELRNTLTDVLQQARQALQLGLTEQDSNGADPVRVFFTDTWEKLAPQLRTLAAQLPEVEGLRYLTFIAATDVIYALERHGAPFGLAMSSDGLRRLARLLIAGKQAN